MTARLSKVISLSFGGDTPTAEFEATFSYVLGPDGPDDVKVDFVEGKPRPWDLGCGFLSDDEAEDIMVNHLSERQLEDMMIDPWFRVEGRAGWGNWSKHCDFAIRAHAQACINRLQDRVPHGQWRITPFPNPHLVKG